MDNVRAYVDTSVFGGPFDEEFENPSKAFFEQIRNGEFALVTAAVVQSEILEAPQDVRDFFNEMLPLAEIVEVTEEALTLRGAYLKAKIVFKKFANDALHVALATVSNCSIIVS